MDAVCADHEYNNKILTNKKFCLPAEKKNPNQQARSGTNLFRCAHCVATFVSKGNLRTHLNVHFVKKSSEGDLYLKCDFCESYFKLKGNLDKHMELNHRIPELRWNKCELCDKTFANKGNYLRHLETHAYEKSPEYRGIKCDLCDKAFANKGNYVRDVQNHVCKKSPDFREHKCELCDKTFASNGNYLRHLKTHAFKKFDFQCPECSKSYKTRSTYNRHVKTHKEGAHECSVCSKKFHEKCTLQRHFTMFHLGFRHYECAICGEKLSQKAFLKNHIIKTHPTDPKVQQQSHKCQFCNSYYRKKIHLSVHIRRRHREKEEPNTKSDTVKEYNQLRRCESKDRQCDDLLATALDEADVDLVPEPDLRTVEIVNAHGRQCFKCDICGYLSSKFDNLRRHMASRHTTTKPYKCSLCDGRFKLTSILRQHLKEIHEIKCKVNSNHVLWNEMLNSNIIITVPNENKSNIRKTQKSEHHERITNIVKRVENNISRVTRKGMKTGNKLSDLSMPLLEDTPETLKLLAENIEKTNISEQLDKPPFNNLIGNGVLSVTNEINIKMDVLNCNSANKNQYNTETATNTTVTKDAVLGQANIDWMKCTFNYNQIPLNGGSNKTSDVALFTEVINDNPIDNLDGVDLSQECDLNDNSLLNIIKLNDLVDSKDICAISEPLSQQDIFTKSSKDLLIRSNNCNVLMSEASNKYIEQRKDNNTENVENSKNLCFPRDIRKLNQDRTEVVNKSVDIYRHSLRNNQNLNISGSSLDVSFGINDLSFQSNIDDISLTDILMDDQNNVKKHGEIQSSPFVDAINDISMTNSNGIISGEQFQMVNPVNSAGFPDQNMKDSTGISNDDGFMLYERTDAIAKDIEQNINFELTETSMENLSLPDIDIDAINPEPTSKNYIQKHVKIQSSPFADTFSLANSNGNIFREQFKMVNPVTSAVFSDQDMKDSTEISNDDGFMLTERSDAIAKQLEQNINFELSETSIANISLDIDIDAINPEPTKKGVRDNLINPAFCCDGTKSATGTQIITNVNRHGVPRSKDARNVNNLLSYAINEKTSDSYVNDLYLNGDMVLSNNRSNTGQNYVAQSVDANNIDISTDMDICDMAATQINADNAKIETLVNSRLQSVQTNYEGVLKRKCDENRMMYTYVQHFEDIRYKKDLCFHNEANRSQEQVIRVSESRVTTNNANTADIELTDEFPADIDLEVDLISNYSIRNNPTDGLLLMENTPGELPNSLKYAITEEKLGISHLGRINETEKGKINNICPDSFEGNICNETPLDIGADIVYAVGNNDETKRKLKENSSEITNTVMNYHEVQDYQQNDQLIGMENYLTMNDSQFEPSLNPNLVHTSNIDNIAFSQPVENEISNDHTYASKELVIKSEVGTWIVKVPEIKGNLMASKEVLEKIMVLSRKNLDYTHKCEQCAASFIRRSDLRRHEKTHVDGPKLLCDLCGKQFSSKRSILYHLQQHNSASSLCWICGAMMKESSFKRHLCVVNYQIKCTFCEKTFQHRGKRLQHIRKTHVANYASKETVRKQRKSSKQYNCHICQMDLPTLSKLWKHQSTVHDYKGEYVCKCGKACRTEAALLLHQKRKHIIQPNNERTIAHASS